MTAAIAKVAESFGVSACQGVLMHQMKRFVIDGNKVVTQKDEVEQHVDEVTFSANEVYAVDVVMSSGDGKPRERDSRTTIFKRAVEQSYRLKMKARSVLFCPLLPQRVLSTLRYLCVCVRRSHYTRLTLTPNPICCAVVVGIA